jgi:hypothetical protein
MKPSMIVLRPVRRNLSFMTRKRATKRSRTDDEEEAE